MSQQRELDLVIFGATGFSGSLAAGYLASAAPVGMRIGLAGRSPERLKAVLDRLGAPAAQFPLLVADMTDAGSLATLAGRTRVLVATTGPYAGRGLPLVEACVHAGTDYADLTGEVLFMRDSIDRFHASAVANGTRIVHACGVDSIPSDLGVLLLAERARADGAGDLRDAIALVTAFRGGYSGGSLATMRRQLAEEGSDAARRGIVADPYTLSPDRAAEPDLGAERDLRWLERDRTLGMWLAGFVMAGANTRVVRRSNAMQGWAYGRRFRYREARAFPGGAMGAARAVATVVPVELLRAAMGWKPAGLLLDALLPRPGEGPGEAQRRSGRFEMRIMARADDGTSYMAHIAADGDPGYAATSVMLGQAALRLTLDRDRLPSAGGVLTPAVALGTGLVGRLRAAGLTFDVGRMPVGTGRSGAFARSRDPRR